MKASLIKTATQAVTRTACKVGRVTKAHSPEILIAVGVASGVAAVVTAAKASKQAESVSEEAHGTIEAIKRMDITPEGEFGERGFSENDRSKAIAVVYLRYFRDMAKTFAVPAGLEVLSITSFLASYGIMRKRAIVLSAAYESLMTAFSEYRGRVAKKLGTDEENQLFRGVETRDITITTPDGKQEIIKNASVLSDTLGPYSRIFDEYARQFNRNDPRYNQYILRMAQNDANDRLKSQGCLFLNEVFDILGMDRSAIGATCGWIYDPEHDHYGGDGYVDFGIDENWRESVERFNRGYEAAVVLNFNCDGPIYNKLNTHKEYESAKKYFSPRLSTRKRGGYSYNGVEITNF